MHGFRFACFLLAPLFAFTSAPADAAGGAAWPQKPIRMVVAPAGSSVDVAARILAEGLKPLLGQPVIVDNKPAAGGTIGAAEVAWSRPDGYTIYLGFNGPLANAKAMYAK